jgi:predicted transposase YbfD/YdcC
MTRDDRTLRRASGALAGGLAGVAFGKLEDPRDVRGRRWGLATLVRVMLVAMLVGMRSLKEAERMTDELSPAMRRKLRVGRRVPDTTMRALAMRLSFQGVLGLLHGQVRAMGRKKRLVATGLPCDVLAIDGKVQTTTLDDGALAQRQSEGHLAVRLMTCALVSAPSAPIVHVTPVPRETNEMGVLPQVLRELRAAYGQELFQLVTADAGMTSEANARLMHEEFHLGYLLALKENQPELLSHAQMRLGGLPHALAQAATRERQGGLRHVRRVWLAREDDGVNGWDHARTLIRVEWQTTTLDGTVTSTLDRYLISNEKAGRFTPEQWLDIVRAHWRVENDVHKTLDVALGEDDHLWIHDPRGMVVLQVLRRIACNALNALRLVTLRPRTKSSHRKRLIEWSHLLGALRRALLAACDHHLDGLRWPQETVAALA